jgi:DNA-binding PadR family transcriptional regulator
MTMARKPQAGPASDPELLILASLAKEPMHGYAILLDIEECFGSRIGPGTLYTAITRLVDKGWIVPDAVSGRQRPYRITGAGATCLEQYLNDMRRVAKIGLGRLRAV